jgi:glycosyltransferase involved in cell wall biosynthesis
MLPGPSFVPASERFTKVSRTADAAAIAQFLSTGNVFWYSLPEGYMDQGPRVLLEAMAAGLPIVADPWGGAVDRVTPETGWLLSKHEQVQLLKTVSLEALAEKGRAARERAQREFVPEKWLELLVK